MPAERRGPAEGTPNTKRGARDDKAHDNNARTSKADRPSGEVCPRASILGAVRAPREGRDDRGGVPGGEAKRRRTRVRRRDISVDRGAWPSGVPHGACRGVARRHVPSSTVSTKRDSEGGWH